VEHIQTTETHIKINVEQQGNNMYGHLKLVVDNTRDESGLVRQFGEDFEIAVSAAFIEMWGHPALKECSIDDVLNEATKVMQGKIEKMWKLKGEFLGE